MARTHGSQHGRATRRAVPQAVPAAVEMSGYADLVGVKARDPMALRDRVEAGLPYSALERLLAALLPPAGEGARLIAIPRRTRAGRKREGKLHPDESDRLLRAARIFSLAAGLFEGDRDAARRWLAEPQPGLGGERPIDLVRTDVGAREVEKVIGRLEQ